VKRPPPLADKASAARGCGRDTLTQLLRILQDEGRALACGDADALAHAVGEKEAALQRLAAEAARADGAALRQLLLRARDENERNARLLAPRLNMNRARLETLFGAVRAGALYLSDGRAAQPQHLSAPRGVRA
jgi:flagellar biosynthesis/type III secretory pathway chaperone